MKSLRNILLIFTLCATGFVFIGCSNEEPNEPETAYADSEPHYTETEAPTEAPTESELRDPGVVISIMGYSNPGNMMEPRMNLTLKNCDEGLPYVRLWFDNGMIGETYNIISTGDITREEHDVFVEKAEQAETNEERLNVINAFILSRDDVDNSYLEIMGLSY